MPIISGAPAAVTGATISAPWATFAPATTGITGEVVNIARWVQIGKIVYVHYSVSGTSNAAGKTFTLPVATAANGANIGFMAYVQDAGTVQTSPGFLSLAAASTTATITKTIAGAGFTASGAWVGLCSFFYEIA